VVGLINNRHLKAAQDVKRMPPGAKPGGIFQEQADQRTVLSTKAARHGLVLGRVPDDGAA
jgi:hypothetical protein